MPDFSKGQKETETSHLAENGCLSYLGDDILHVAARVVCAVIIAEPVEHRLRLKLVLVCH